MCFLDPIIDLFKLCKQSWCFSKDIKKIPSCTNMNPFTQPWTIFLADSFFTWLLLPLLFSPSCCMTVLNLGTLTDWWHSTVLLARCCWDKFIQQRPSMLCRACTSQNWLPENVNRPLVIFAYRWQCETRRIWETMFIRKYDFLVHLMKLDHS